MSKVLPSGIAGVSLLLALDTMPLGGAGICGSSIWNRTAGGEDVGREPWLALLPVLLVASLSS